MSDINIKINASNLSKEAFAAVAEALKGLQDGSQQTGEKLQGAGEHVEGLGARLTGLKAACEAAKATLDALAEIGLDWVHSASAQEDATVRLATALKAQGMFTPQLAQQYDDLASSFQNTTVFSDELVGEMEALLVQVGNVMPKDMKAALAASTDLAAGLRIDLKSATELVAKGLEGNTTALKKHGIVVDETAFKVQGASAVFEAISSKMGGQAAAQAQTLSGQMARLGNVVDNVKETLGGLIGKALTPLMDGFMSLDEGTRTGIIAFGLLAGAAGALAFAITSLTAVVKLALPMLGGIEGVTAGATKALGFLGTAAAVAAAGFIGWEIGRWIADITGADKAVEHLAVRLFGWSDQAQVAGAKQDSINLAIKRGAEANISYGDAIKYNQQWSEQHAATLAKSVVSVDANAAAFQRLKDKANALAVGALKPLTEEQAAIVLSFDKGNVSAAAMVESFKGVAQMAGVNEAQIQLTIEAHKKAVAASDEHAKALARIRAAFIPLTEAQENYANTELAAGSSTGDVAKQLGVAEAQVTNYTKAIKTATDQTKTWIALQNKLNDENLAGLQKLDQASRKSAVAKMDADTTAMFNQRDLGRKYAEEAYQLSLSDTERKLRQIDLERTAMIDALHIERDGRTETTDKALADIERITDAAKREATAIEASDPLGLGTAIKSNLHDVGLQLPQMLASTLGSGNVKAAIEGTASMLGAGFGSGIGMVLGGPMGAAIGSAIGSLAGPLVGKIGKLLGIGATDYEKRMQAAAQETSTLQTNLIASHGGMAQLIRDADSVGINIKEAFSWQDPAALKQVIAELDKGTANLTARTNTQLGALLAFSGTYRKLPDDMVPYIDQLENAGKLTKENADLLRKMSGDSTTDFDHMKTLADQFGISLDSLGPKFQQQQLTQTATGIIQAFDELTQGGADYNGVLAGMADEISGVVQNSLKFGTEIPANMKPWIEDLAKSGQLLDANKQQITDTSSLKFGAEIQVGLGDVVDLLKEMVGLLSNGLPDAIARLPKNVDINVNTTHSSDGGGDGSYDEPPPFAKGGMIEAGSGTLARLHGLEGVVPLTKRSAMMDAIVSTVTSVSGDSGGGNSAPITIRQPIYLDGRQIAESVLTHQPDILRMHGVR